MTQKKGSETGIIKPFYKKAWFWALMFVVIAGVGGTFIVRQVNRREIAHKIAQQGNLTKTTRSSAKETKKITRSDFDSIELGDVLDHGKGGDTVDDLTERFGYPSSDSTRDDQEFTFRSLMWHNVDGKSAKWIMVNFVNDKACQKILQSPEIISNRKISLANYNAIKNGMKYSELIKKIGQPDTYAVTSPRGRSSVEVLYSLEDSKNSMAIVEAFLMDGVVTRKTKIV